MVHFSSKARKMNHIPLHCASEASAMLSKKRSLSKRRSLSTFHGQIRHNSWC
ncbi:MAG: hypothetical protein U5L45_17825 [Saprospiraceae bacterium]|nr:hypothetical protein [Saprospiraceae bacterium]